MVGVSAPLQSGHSDQEALSLSFPLTLAPSNLNSVLYCAPCTPKEKQQPGIC